MAVQADASFFFFSSLFWNGIAINLVVSQPKPVVTKRKQMAAINTNTRHYGHTVYQAFVFLILIVNVVGIAIYSF